MGDKQLGVGALAGCRSDSSAPISTDYGEFTPAVDSSSNGSSNSNGSGDNPLSAYERFLTGLNQTTARLLAGATLGDLDVLDALSLLGGVSGVERIHLYRHVADATGLGHAVQEYEWVSDPSYSLAERPDLLVIPWEGQGESVREKLLAGEAVYMRIDTLPEREQFIPNKMGNKSTLLIPIETRGRLWGHVAFNSLAVVRGWNQAEVAALCTAANAFGSAIDRMHLERQLSQSLAENIVRSQRAEDRFRLLTESMQDILWVYNITLSKFTYASPSVEPVAGYTPDEVRELSFDQVVATAYAESSRQFIKANHTKLLESGQDQGEFITIELDLCHKLEGRVPVEVVVRFQRDAVSGHVEMVGAARDISDRKRIQQALADSEEHYRLLAENSMDVVLRLGRDATVQWASPSLREALGWTPQDWVGTEISSRVV